jgi:hypothetical protein
MERTLSGQVDYKGRGRIEVLMEDDTQILIPFAIIPDIKKIREDHMVEVKFTVGEPIQDANRVCEVWTFDGTASQVELISVTRI